ncbi:MAG: hypothetical protein ACOZAR_02495 [Patescibacteria group bacterium]
MTKPNFCPRENNQEETEERIDLRDSYLENYLTKLEKLANQEVIKENQE